MTNEMIIKKIIAEQIQIQPTDFDQSAVFKEELCTDSLDFFSIINDVEEHFDIQIITDDEIITVGDLFQVVERAVSQKMVRE